MFALPLLAGLSLLLPGCGRDGDSPPQRQVAVARAQAAVACTGTGAHDAHAAMNLGCAVCHPCGGVIQLNGYTYPRGTTATGTITLATSTTPTTCAVGCHSPIGAPAHTVAWNQGPLDCTACHTPTALPSTHPVLAASVTGTDCVVCHDTSKHTTGTIVFAPHPISWMDQSSTGFHAFDANKGLAACQACHAQDLTGGTTGVACAQCHDLNLPTGITTWKQNCLMCHGAAVNATGAPPRTTWGNGADLVRVGAHTAHVTASPISQAFDCAICHVKPADALAPGHIDGPTATVTFNGLASGSGTPAPAWDRASATCSNTYCHGATLASGTNTTAGAGPLVPRNTTPIWTVVDGTQASCGACHGLPPDTGQHAVHAGLGRDCYLCHNWPYSTRLDLGPPAADPARHVNGAKDVSLLQWDADLVKPGSTTERGTSAGCHSGTRYWYVTSGSCL
jgi:predicted CxxxxCH...CXXCH cytochrome family protein